MNKKPASGSKTSKRKSVKGKVGIFWWHNNRVLAMRSCVRRGADVDYRYFHENMWPVLQYQHPELRLMRHAELPQGRVWFTRAEQRFWVQMDREIFQPRIKAAVLRAFGLPRKSTDFSIYVR